MGTNENNAEDDGEDDMRDPGVLRRHWLSLSIGIVSAVGIALIITAPLQPAPGGTHQAVDSYEIRGLLSLTGPDGILVSTSDTIDSTGDSVCWGQSQYRDIGVGTPVTVYDDRDAIVALGKLGQGRTSGKGMPVDGSCVFPIVVNDVPAESAFYQVEVARRGTVLVPNMPTNGVLHVFASLDEQPGSLPEVADAPPQIPDGISTR